MKIMSAEVKVFFEYTLEIIHCVAMHGIHVNRNSADVDMAAVDTEFCCGRHSAAVDLFEREKYETFFFAIKY